MGEYIIGALATTPSNIIRICFPALTAVKDASLFASAPVSLAVKT